MDRFADFIVNEEGPPPMRAAHKVGSAPAGRGIQGQAAIGTAMGSTIQSRPEMVSSIRPDVERIYMRLR